MQFDQLRRREFVTILGGTVAIQFCTMADEIPTLPGAYLLLIELTKAIAVKLPKSTVLIPGYYLYAGSAYGPGGLKARISRHMRRAKPCRWHIDQITEGGNVRGAWIFPSGNECELIELYPELPMPITRFGSTDCNRCRSHLLGPTSAFGLSDSAL